ncbi:MAG: CDP-glycerol glycerophosphotransferase, partial [Actinomycetota bacterium]|nr:CDP-glycerol glycerophosphotransferase [Actinomycetota bacterium]
IGEPPGPMEFRGRSWAPAERPRDPFLRTSLDLVLSPSGRVVSVAVPLVHEQGRFSVKMDPEAIPTLAGDVPLTTGLWKFYLRAGPDGELLRVRVAPEALQQLPRRSPEGARAMSLFASETGNLSFNVRPPVSQAALSRAGQKRLRAGVYAPAIQQHVLDQVLVDGYADGRYGDDVREIVEGLTSRGAGSDIVWTTDDGLTPRPDGVRCVTRYSREWHEAVARSRHVVMTDRLGLGELEGRDDQTVLQVWHGVPVRPFGLRDEMIETRHGRADLRRETARWDMVLSTGPAHSKVLRDDFGVEHAVETGLPRHDLLVDPERAEERARRAAQTRVRLGLSADARVVLWAPTHLLQQVRPGQYLLEWPMDPATLDDALGDDHVLVVRRHPKTSCLRVAEAESVDSEVPESDVAIRTSRVVDASLLPDVRDLLLCADVLVTDRSSLLVDRALTGKPSVFFLHGQAGEDGHIPISALPGRVVTEAAALVEAIHAATDEEPAHAKARESLLDTWVPRRDGRATDRVLDALLLRQDPPGKTHGAGGTAGSSTTTALDVS